MSFCACKAIIFSSTTSADVYKRQHFTPTSASWLNMVERFFRDLTCKRLRRGVFTSVPTLIDAINAYIQATNQAPKPFIWTAKATDILEKVKLARESLHKSVTG